MSTINIEVKNNFSTVLSNLNTQEELSAVANAIREQLINAVNTRKNEITAGTKTVSVEISVNTSAVEVAPEPVKTESKKSMADSAKEVAAKMKKEKSGKKNEKKNEPAPSVKSDDAIIAITDLDSIKKLNLTWEKYSDKCWVLRGDTKPLRKVLREELRGSYRPNLRGQSGWAFTIARAKAAAEALGLKLETA